MPYLDRSGSEIARGVVAFVLVGVSLAATGLAMRGCARQEATPPAAREKAAAPKRGAPARAQASPPAVARAPTPAPGEPPSASGPAPGPAPVPPPPLPPPKLSAASLHAAGRVARGIAAARPEAPPGGAHVAVSHPRPVPLPEGEGRREPAPPPIAGSDSPPARPGPPDAGPEAPRPVPPAVRRPDPPAPEPAPPPPRPLDPAPPAPPYPYAAPTWKAALARSLDEQPISVDVGSDASLEKVLEWLALESGVPIRVHPRAAPTVAAARVGRIRARALPLKNVLALALANGAPSLRACLEDGAVMIAPRDHRPQVTDGECVEVELYAMSDLETVLGLDLVKAKPEVRQQLERVQMLHVELSKVLRARPLDDAGPIEGPAHAVLERLGRLARVRIILAEPLWQHSAGRVVPPFRAATLGEALDRLEPLLGVKSGVAWDDTLFGEFQALLGVTGGRSLGDPVIRLR